MIYADLPAGATVFLDSSVFIHHFEPNVLFGPAATESSSNASETKRFSGITCTHIISEVAHRLMTIEAMQAFDWKSAGLATRLRNHSTQVQTLKRFRQAIQEIPLFGIRILTIDPTWLETAAGISQQTGPLHNDALVIAVMRAHGLTNLASADPDFDPVPGITRYGPP